MAQCEFVESKEYDYKFKTVQLGQHGCGKSALLERFADDSFQETYMLVNDFKVQTIKFENKIIRLLMWDEPVGKERFSTISLSYYRGANGIFVIFDITDRSSLKYVENYLHDMVERDDINKEVAKILIGNKCDLNEQRAISTKEAQTFADEWNMQYFETSAKSGDNVHESVLAMLKKMVMTQDKLVTNELNVPTKTQQAKFCTML